MVGAGARPPTCFSFFSVFTGFLGSVMAFFNWRRWLGSVSRPRRLPIRNRSRFVPEVEGLEDRTLLATLPTALVSNPQAIATGTAGGFSPALAQDPVNPLKLIEVHSTGTLPGINPQGTVLSANYSTDGGQTWTSFAVVSTGPFAASPSVAIDRAENVYIVDIEHDATNSSGALVLRRFIFSGGSPNAVASETNVAIQRWLNSDPIENAVVGGDNNVPSFTDSGAASNNVQTDTMATLVHPAGDANPAGVGKSLYVAWNTSFLAAAHPNLIMTAGSGDGGLNWTSPQYVSDGGNNPATPLGAAAPHYADPKIVFSQGSADGQVTGGQVLFGWNDYSNSTFLLDSSQADNGLANQSSVRSTTFAGNAGAFSDACAPVTAISSASGGN